MINKIKFRLINHLLRQNDWMQTKLKPYQGMTLHLEIRPLTLNFLVGHDGQLSLIDNKKNFDASIQMDLKSFIQLITKKKRMGISITGNIDLAHDFSDVIKQVEWDIEEDLSQIIGDIPATEIINFGKKMFNYSKNNIQNLAENFIEYWQEENKLLSKSDSLEKFYSEVDLLLEDVDRIEAKIDAYATTRAK